MNAGPDRRLVRLSKVDVADLATLFNDVRVTRHMPLAREMTENDVREWVRSKGSIWAERGYGPWAILVDGQLAGWAGLSRLGPSRVASTEIDGEPFVVYRLDAR